MPAGPQFLMVRTGGRRCALPLGMVRRVLRGLQVHPVPAGDRRLMGLAQFGGEPLAVVDLAAIVGEVGSGHGAGLTVVLGRRRSDSGASLLGLSVDEVEEVATLAAEPAPGEPPIRLDPEWLTRWLEPSAGDDGTGRRPEGV